jgi:Cu/Ag efflux pump CusA
MLNKIGDIFLLLNIALRSKLAALLVMVNLPLGADRRYAKVILLGGAMSVTSLI